jgi:hypothetical protein
MDVVYHQMDYEDLVQLEGALMAAVGQLGLQELEKKKKH